MLYSPALYQALTNPAVLRMDGTLSLVMLGALVVGGYIYFAHNYLVELLGRSQASAERKAA
ncbi:MAG: hypothetical protein K6V97_13930 [Actinomycetia bacterium]|jgi:hypothetical protein|nr:hypothetical protein [Actinomycetes bacterium]